jgi:phosphatidylinositol phospholipase C delta
VQSGFVGSRKLEACRAPDLDPENMISIFHNNVNTMDFLVEDEDDRKSILSAIQKIREAYDASKVMMPREELLLRYAWYDIDRNKSGLIEQPEFLQLLCRINIYLKTEKAIKIFKDCIASKRLKKGGFMGSIRRIKMMTQQHQNGITFDECMGALRTIKLEKNGGQLTTDIIFDELFGDKDVVTAEEFLTKFLQPKQNEWNSTIDDVKKIFSQLNGMKISGSRTGADGWSVAESIDRVRFAEYLFSSGNDVFDPEKQKLDNVTLSRPLPEYWINSSHNTYLTGNQFQSGSSVQMYFVAMQR